MRLRADQSTSADPCVGEVSVPLGEALRTMLWHPVALAREWNWKAAILSAVLRAGMFLRINLRAGHGSALKAMAVEAVYATVAAGLAGAATQRLRHAVPRGRTAMVVWFAIPAAMLAAQAAVHGVMGTPRLRSSMAASLVFAALATGFNWFAMSRGAFVTGEGRSFGRDVLLLPKLLVQFVCLAPRMLFDRRARESRMR